MKAKKAYENLAFLKSSVARPIRILAEYLEPKARFEAAGVRGTIVIMGSSRLLDPQRARRMYRQAQRRNRRDPDNPEVRYHLRVAETLSNLAHYYTDAVEVARRLTEWSQRQPPERRFLVCTGAGPGIMEAGNRGAHAAGGESVGLGISLPIKEPINRHVTPRLSFIFHYFFMRKFWFIYLAKAVIMFPGGFGTMDELFEVLTLKHTHKVTKPMPVVLYGRDFWERIVDWDLLMDMGYMMPGESDLFRYCDTPDEVCAYLLPILEQWDQ